MAGPVAFVLGGGGVRGAAEVGMLAALLKAGIVPDLVVGSSVGAINGALIAADPSLDAVRRLVHAWTSPTAEAIYGDSFPRQMVRLARTKTHLISSAPLRRLLEEELGGDVTFDQLAVPLRVVAASIERASEHWFSSGRVIDAVLASASVPGVMRPTRIGGEHFIDGGVVNSIPLGEAARAGAVTIFVLHVGRIEEQLVVPRRPVDTAKVAFEVSRRHRFAREVAELSDDVALHVLPTGGSDPGDERLLAYRRMGPTRARIERAYTATREYLAAQHL